MDLNGVEKNMTTSTENPTASPTTTTNTTDTDTGERDNHGKKKVRYLRITALHSYNRNICLMPDDVTLKA